MNRNLWTVSIGIMLLAWSLNGYATDDVTVTTLAGLAGSSGSTDGTGSAARFKSPERVVVDTSGNMYVADTWNHTIRKVTSAGVATTVAGSAGNSGSADGTGNAARFYCPVSVAVDTSGNVYVADAYNHTIRKVTSAGVVTTVAGSAGNFGSTDGTGSAARFKNPGGVAVDTSGNVYVADHNNHTIRKVTSEGVVTTLAGSAGSAGSTDGTGSAARFNLPAGVAVDTNGNVYVAGYGDHTIRKVTSAGVATTVAGSAGSAGSTDGTGSAARFNLPFDVAVDANGNIYVADPGNHTIRKVTSEGVVTTLAGSAGNSGSADGTGSTARFNNPLGVAVYANGNIYVVDTSNHTIRKITISGGSSAGTLQFNAASASVNENAGSVSLTVTRSGGSSGAASVNYATANGTASAGTDYTATNGTFNWADGNSDSKTIIVPISDDSVVDGGKYFTVQLSSASGASLGSPYSATVTIVDNETPDTTSPTAAITSPTSDSTYSTASYSINIGGTASDNIGVTRVTWANDRGGSGDCSGTTSWSTNGITLYSGQNTITVTAYDAAGNSGSDTLAVTYTPPVLSASISLLSGFGELYVNNTISLYANVSGAQGITSYQWDLDGDGSFGDESGQQVSWQYNTQGTRLVQVRVNDVDQSTTASKFITIGKYPVNDELSDQPPATDPEPGSARDAFNGDNAFTNWSKKDNGLIIIVHGMETNSSVDWVWKMAKEISSRLGSNSCPNIMAWDWEEIAKSYSINIDLSNWYPIFTTIRGRAQNQGQQLAEWIDQNVTANNINQNEPIHIIGHSGGGWVAGGCINSINRKIDQITTFDTPFYSAGIVTRYLPAGDGRRADFYIAERSCYPVARIPASSYQRIYHGSLYWYEVTDNVEDHDTHGGIPYWYFVNTIAGLEQNGFWYSPWGLYSGPLPIRMAQKNDVTAGGYQVAKQSVSDFQTFGSVSVADGVYTITEGAGNAGIYKSTAFSSDAKAVMFEYKFTQAGDGDFLSVHVGTNEAVFIGEENGLSRQSFVLGEGDLSAVTGTTAMLTFKLVSRGQPNAQVQVRSIEILTENENSFTPLAADFDGDHLADPATVVSSNWYVWFSGSGYARGGPYSLSQADSTPLAGDFDGDQKADPAAVDSSGTWSIRLSASDYAMASGSFAVSDGTPVAGDFDGDGKADPAMVDSSGNWYVWFSGSGYTRGGPYSLGQAGSTPVASDFDGDQKADPAAVDSSGTWSVRLSASDYAIASGSFALSGGMPAAGDFDGDGKADPAMVDSSGNWYVWFSASGYVRGGPYALTAP